MAKSGNSSALSLAELAPLLGLSKSRCHQLVDEGVIPRGPGGRIDPLEAAIGVLGWYRRDEQTKQARLRLLHASAANHERRLRRQVRQLLTTAELREVLLLGFERGWELVQSQVAVFHGELAARLPDDQARIAAHAIYTNLRLTMIGYRNGVDSLVQTLERELLPAEARVSAVFDQIMSATMAGESGESKPRPARANGKRPKRLGVTEADA